MPHAEVGADELLERVPGFMHRLARMDSADPVCIDEALEAAGLTDAAPCDDDRAGRYRHVTLAVRDGEDLEAMETRLRAAISRTVGKPSGTDKHWDVGGRAVTMSCRGTVSLTLTAQLSMSALRSAAADWLNGADLDAWLVEHRFVDPGAEPDDDGAWPGSKDGPVRARVRSSDDGVTRVSFFMEPGVRPPGSRADDDDERYAQTLAYLDEELGEAWPEGWWHRGSRSLSIHRQRSYSRSVTFVEAPAGRVGGPGLIGLVALDPTPRPDPRHGAAQVAKLAAVRGLVLDEAHARLVAAGVVTEAPPQERPGAVALCDPHGRDIELTLVDGCVARSLVQVAADSKDMHERVDDAFTAAFGDPVDGRTWLVGEMVVTFSRAGQQGFERLRAQVAEPTVSAVRAARGWLLSGEAVGEVLVRDRWHGRCAGAAISADVVPAVSAGAPIWKVDDRLLWIEDGRLVAAGQPDWPAWSAELPTGGTTDPIPAPEIATFAETLRGLRAPVPYDLVSAAVGLGWATEDPDALTTSGNGDVAVRLHRPADGVLKAQVRDDGTVKAWTLAVSCHAGAGTAAKAAADVGAALAAYRNPARKQGWQIGTSAVKPQLTHHSPAFYLMGTIAAAPRT